MVTTTPSLLPTHHDEFRSKDYWDRFFLERNGAQFEWYGAYADLKANIKRRAAEVLARGGVGTTVLVVGCGNSEISADLYDDGFPSITNLDFSPLVRPFPLKPCLLPSPSAVSLCGRFY